MIQLVYKVLALVLPALFVTSNIATAEEAQYFRIKYATSQIGHDGKTKHRCLADERLGPYQTKVLYWDWCGVNTKPLRQIWKYSNGQLASFNSARVGVHYDNCLFRTRFSNEDNIDIDLRSCKTSKDNKSQKWTYNKKTKRFVNYGPNNKATCLKSEEWRFPGDHQNLVVGPCGSSNKTSIYLEPISLDIAVPNEMRNVWLKGKCLGVPDGSKVKGTGVITWDCNRNIADQVWEMSNSSIVNVHSNQCLAVAGASKHNAAPVVIWPCYKGEEQKWEVVTYGSGPNAVHYKNKNSGLCLAAHGGKHGGQVFQADCNKEYDDQKWSRIR